MKSRKPENPSKELVDALLATIPFGINIIDEQGNILFLNDIFLKKYGRSAIGRQCLNVIKCDQKSCPDCPLKTRVGIGETATAEVTDYADGSSYEITYTGLLFKDKKAYLEIFRDISERKEIDRAKTEFVSLASHQLRTPLAGIGLASELFLRNADDNLDEGQRGYLKEIFDSTKKMSSLIDDLLNVSRIELGTFNIENEKLNPADATNAILDNLKSQFKEKNFMVKREFSGDAPNILFDKRAFNLIVENLLTNAIRYTPKNGSITVSIKSKNKALVIEVSDTGYGVPAKEGDKIFSKLFRAANAKKIAPEGEGLGLYIVKLVADQMGAEVWFEPNKAGRGSTFFVSISLT